MRIILSLLLMFIYLNANRNFSQSTICKGCHPTIYKEFYNSSHKKSTLKSSPLHKALWDIHPKKEQNNYSCAKCHEPTNKEDSGISCAYCHSIESIQEHTKVNKNILNKNQKVFFSANEDGKKNIKISFKEESTFFGLFTKTKGSPFHKIDYSNSGYYDGKICMGCHSHKKNKNDFTVCSMKKAEFKPNEDNCISCHMPKVLGTATTIKKTKTHTFHGFAGVNNRPDLLAKYIKLDIKFNDNGFEVFIKNSADHPLFLHALRVAKLNISIKRAEKTIKLQPTIFVKILGKDNKPAMVWEADSIIKNSMIKAKENRIIKYDFKLEKDDIVNIEFGYYKVNPKVLKKLNIKNKNKITKFTTLIEKSFRK